jgi:RimJ/RimL family protein N-acetyltransferase
MSDIRLEPVSLKHLKKMVEWRNKPRVYESFFSKAPTSVEQQLEWINTHSDVRSEKNFIILLEEVVDLGIPPAVGTIRYLGAISLYDIDYINKRAEFGRFYIGENDCLGKGYGKETLRVLLDYGFNVLNLNKIYADVFSTNYKIIELYKEFKFVVEALLVKHYFVGGEFIDVTRMSVFRSDWYG